MKPRFAVDLDEVERQLRHAAQPPSQPSSQPPPPPAPQVGRGDPLAELAKIVGQEDPFGSLLANDKPARPRAQPAFEEIFAPRPDQSRMAAQAPAYPEPQAYRPAAVEQSYAAPASYQQPTAQRAEPESAGYAEPYDQGYYQDEASAEDDTDYLPQRAQRSRKGLVAVASVLGAAVLGVGAALTLGGKGTPVGGEPPLVQASAEPTKVQPQSPGGVEIPNQNKQIYERAAHDSQTKVVNREEQPVDVRQAMRVVPPSPETTATTTAAAQPATALAGLGEPRRVRTLSIRPDGTVIPDPAARPAVPVAGPAAMTLPAAAQAQMPVGPRPPVAAASTTPVAPRTAAATPASPTGGASPQAAASPAASQTAPQRVASAVPTAMAAPVASTTPAPEASSGGFAVQLAVRPSEAEARTAFQQLQQKFPDLGGRSPVIRKAEVNGNTLFRVRVGPLSKDDASSLCTKLQGSGGQCFVAKN